MSCPGHQEWEIPLIQRGFVDNCFEEGQYEYGIDFLDKLRGQGYKPPPLHVRTLVYIALYPLPPNSLNGVERIEMTLSPRKIQAQRHKNDIWPKPSSRPLAISLLQAFVDTNSPECLMRALPFYTYTDNDGMKDVNVFSEADLKGNHDDNSPLKKELAIIQSQKDCWQMLKAGFIKRKQQDYSSCTDNTVRKDDSKESVGRTVGPYAWPVLEWMVRVFEKDQRMKAAAGQSTHSPLLLTQIPPPRSKKGPRWEVEMPVQVAMACLAPDRSEQSIHDMSLEKRQDLGSRLIALLVNLTLTTPPLLSTSHLLHILTLKLLGLPFNSFLSMFVGIPADHTQFKISLLESCLASSMGGSITAQDTTKSRRAAPRVKAKRSEHVNTIAKDESTVQLPSSLKERSTETYTLPTQDKLIHLLSVPLPPVADADSEELSPVKAVFAKFYLISALYQLRKTGQLTINDQWDTVVRNGTLQTAVINGTAVNLENQDDPDCDMIEAYRANVLEIIKVWATSSDGDIDEACNTMAS